MNVLARPLARNIYSASQVRELDRTAIETFGIPGYELMSRAGQAALDALQRHWPLAERLLIYCGAGNNAGDGYVLARLAANAGFKVTIRAVTDPEKLKGDAATAWLDCQQAPFAFEPYWREGQREPIEADLLVDALLGTGLDRALGGRYAELVAEINGARLPVLALDIPTGLHADTGLALGDAVRATVTLTFVGQKSGNFLGVGPDFCGHIEFCDLGVPAAAYAPLVPVLQRLEPGEIAAALPRRRRSAHKGSHGRLLLVGGGPGMGGAIRLAAEAALRTGAGLVYVATHPSNVQTVMSGRPEIICRGLEIGALAAFAETADAVVLGPGLGRGDWSRAVWAHFIDTDRPLVLDADGLNLLAEMPRERGQWLLTPHPGEAARLLGASVPEIEADRLGAAKRIAAERNAAVVLKGANSLVAMPGASPAVFVCTDGNPGMATAGMGDVLSGVLGGLLVQSRRIEQSARAGVLLHALAGDAAAQQGGERGLIASDLMPHLRRCANP